MRLFVKLNLFFASLLLSACVSNGSRHPSSYKKQVEVSFQLFNTDSLFKKEYRFELLSLFELPNQKIQFQKYDVELNDSQKSLKDWLQQLKSYNANFSNNIEFNANKRAINIKSSDFKRLERALELIEKSNEMPNIIYRKQISVISAFNQNFKEPLEVELEILTLPFEILNRLTPFSVREKTEETPLKIENSSFWTDRSTAQVNMSLGAGDFNPASLDSVICQYNGPKKGFGIHQGFKAKCLDKKFKVKLGETHSAPLNARLYHRLGYNVPAIHYLKNIRLAYDRKLFTEIESGKQQYLRLKLLKNEIKAFPIRKRNHFRNFVAHAVLKNGEKIARADFFKKLLAKCASVEDRCHLQDSSYDADFESTIEHIVFGEIAVVEETNDHDFGKWAYDELDYGSRPEVKALVLIGAMTGNHDLRKDNNVLIWSAKNYEIKHSISDPGTGYGARANNMPWSVLKVQMQSSGETDPHKKAGIVVENYRPYADHKAFAKLNMNEAKWMARQIAAIAEDELTEALAASGFNVAELLLTREKLVSIQKNLIEVLEIESEFPVLRVRKINKRLNYLPSGSPRIFKLNNGKEFLVEEEEKRLENGKLK